MIPPSVRTSGIPLGPLADREVLVHLEEGVAWWRAHLSESCPAVLERTEAQRLLFLDAASSTDLCHSCLPTAELLLSPEERPYLCVAQTLAPATMGLTSVLGSPCDTWVAASGFLAYLAQFEQVDASSHPDLLRFQTSLASSARKFLDDALSRLRSRGDRRLLALYAAYSLRTFGDRVWDSKLPLLESQASSLVRFESIPLLPRLLRTTALPRLQERLASSKGTVSICGPLPSIPGDLRVLFRIALLRWGNASTAPVVLEVPSLVADVLSPVAPHLCAGPIPSEVAETFLVLWDGESDPRPALEASGAILS